VLNGRSTRGRLTVRLPGTRADWPGWEAVNWGTVGRDVGRKAAASWVRETAEAAHALGAPGRLGGYGTASPGPLLDDIVVTVDLLRTTARLPARPGARAVQPAPERPATEELTLPS